MNVQIESTEGIVYTAIVILSERNLRTLLEKLDEPMSQRTLVRRTESGVTLWVIAEKDEEHYKARTPGKVHPREEAKLRKVG